MSGAVPPRAEKGRFEEPVFRRSRTGLLLLAKTRLPTLAREWNSAEESAGWCL